MGGIVGAEKGRRGASRHWALSAQASLKPGSDSAADHQKFLGGK